ncbi:MAG: lamin tail domain-containing protein [Deltaproteobacteria bacterium]|nr:lamin tail domain-containing protein [Deltaproteobacteria bacterium]
MRLTSRLRFALAWILMAAAAPDASAAPGLRGRADRDLDGVEDELDCAPEDAAFGTRSCDADGDGYCSRAISGRVQAAFCPLDCGQGLCRPNDCDDNPAMCGAGCFPLNPAPDICDGVDQDCDGQRDEDPDLRWFADSDLDGYTASEGSVLACEDPDGDQAVWLGSATEEDCDDGQALSNPGLDEDCSDGIDNDCDGLTDGADDDCPVCGNGRLDGGEACDDGGLAGGDGCDPSCELEVGWACRQEPGSPSVCGHIASAGEVVISEIMVNPGCVTDSAGEYVEIRNAADRDLVLRGWLLGDRDTDAHVLRDLVLPLGGYAVICRHAQMDENGGVACDAEASMVLANARDELRLLDPDDVLIDEVAYDTAAGFPDLSGAAMVLTHGADATANDEGASWCSSLSVISHCGDLGSPGLPNRDCGSACWDRDQDGHEARPCGGDDCDDMDPDTHPGAEERCGDGVDNDCDGLTDMVDDLCCDDADEDGYGEGCGAGPDCDDADPAVHPGAAESCADGLDNDCDGRTDGQDLDCGGLCSDRDLDGYTDRQCGGNDCDDDNADVHPGATERCDDELDNDCDGAVDAQDDDCASGEGCGCRASAPEASPWIALAALCFWLRRRGLLRAA